MTMATHRRWLAAASIGLLAATAFATAQAAGGLSLTPTALEQFARPGKVGAITVNNTSANPLKVTITLRPWLQSRNGAVAPDRRTTLSSLVALSARSFTLPPGSKRHVVLTLRRLPAAKSLYGSVEVVGVPPKTTAKKSGIVAAYQLIGSLRLNPHVPVQKLRLRAGAARVTSGRILVAMKNTGNTVDPVTGTAVITGAHGRRTVAVPSARILPGATVDLRLGASKGLPNGAYAAKVSLFQGGKPVLIARRGFRVNR